MSEEEWSKLQKDCHYLTIETDSGANSERKLCGVTGEACNYDSCPALVPKLRIRKSLFTGETWAFVTDGNGKVHRVKLGRW